MVTEQEIKELEKYLEGKDKEKDFSYPTEMLRKLSGTYSRMKLLESEVDIYKTNGIIADFVLQAERLDKLDLDSISDEEELDEKKLYLQCLVEDGLDLCSQANISRDNLVVIENIVLSIKEKYLPEIERIEARLSDCEYSDKNIEMEL